MANPQRFDPAIRIATLFKARAIESRNAFLQGRSSEYVLHDYIVRDICEIFSNAGRASLRIVCAKNLSSQPKNLS
ncbi:MAG: hypothetical protein V4661_14515, partial [Pseudomonadota bacterium]